MSATVFLAQRVTAAILAFRWSRTFRSSSRPSAPASRQARILSRTHGNRVLFAFYALFVIAAAIHAPIGLRNIIAEWTGWRGRSLDIAMAAFALALLGLGLRAVFAVYSA